ncbi:MAG: methyl-accepting chemotaxis protein [Pseudomonadota bacterium]
MRNKIVLGFLGVILWILTVNFLSSLFIDDPWKSQALSAAVGLLVGMIFGISISNTITKNLSELVKAAIVTSDGDLTQEIKVHSTDEIGELATALRKMLSSLQKIISRLKNGASGVITSSEGLYESIQKMSTISEQVTSAVEKVVKAAETQSDLIVKDSVTLKSISDSVSKIAGMAKVAYNSAARAVKNSQDGKEAAQSAIEQIQGVFSQVEKSIILAQGLGSKITKINRVLEVISDIARKTDLLSLNATVEAAKAGEYGKGFGIVAEEIRYLTEESKDSAKDIGLLIEEIQSENASVRNSIEEGIKGVKNGRGMITTLIKNFDQIVDEVTRLGGGFEEISIETNRQAMDSGRIVQAFGELTKLAQENSFAMQATVKAIKDQGLILEGLKTSGKKLRDTADAFNEEVKKFKVSDG